MSALVICSHLPGEGHCRSKRFNVVPIVCDDDFSYWAGLNEAWSTGLTLINIEHDMEVTDEHVQALLDCPHELCTHVYRCHWVSTHIAGGVLAAGAGARDIAKRPDAYYLQGGEEWANWSAIGLVKITPQARVGPLERAPWSSLELSVEAAVQGPWHVHGNASEGWVTDLPDVIHHHW